MGNKDDDERLTTTIVLTTVSAQYPFLLICGEGKSTIKRPIPMGLKKAGKSINGLLPLFQEIINMDSLIAAHAIASQPSVDTL